MKFDKKLVMKTVTVIMAVTVVVIAIYIMVNKMGLIPGLDFGAGAYYYVDVPDFEKIVDQGAYQTEVPVWVHVVLFVAWGWLMWRLWAWIDRH